MTDIVGRLRSGADGLWSTNLAHVPEAMTDAADEIERLRFALQAPQDDRVSVMLSKGESVTDQYFTLVFRGSIRDFDNPLKTETPFGIPFACGIGDAFAENEELRELLERLPQERADG